MHINPPRYRPRTSQFVSAVIRSSKNQKESTEIETIIASAPECRVSAAKANPEIKASPV